MHFERHTRVSEFIAPSSLIGKRDARSALRTRTHCEKSSFLSHVHETRQPVSSEGMVQSAANLRTKSDRSHDARHGTNHWRNSGSSRKERAGLAAHRGRSRGRNWWQAFPHDSR